MDEWITKNSRDITVCGLATNITNLIDNLKNEIKDIKKKKKDAHINRHLGLLDYLQRQESSLYREIDKHNESLMRGKLHTIKYTIEDFPPRLIVDYHFLRVHEAVMLGDMLLCDNSHGFRNMVWVTGIGNHSKGGFGVLKAKLKDLLIYYDIKYEESPDRLSLIL